MTDYKTRKRLALLILLVGLPLYAALAFGWALPFRGIFRGVGQADPGEEEKKRP